MYLWAKALLLALIAVQLVRLALLILTPVGPLGDWRPATPRLLSAEAQAEVLSAVDPFFRNGSGSAPVPAALVDLQLFGTRQGSGSLPGSAVLGEPEGEQKSYLVGEEVSPGVKLATVAFDHVVLDRAGVRQTIYMPTADGSAPGAGDPSAAQATRAAPPSVADAFDLRPRNAGSNVTGVIVGPGSNPTLFQAAGFRAGDVVVAVNGARISSLIDVQQLQSSLAPGARLTLTVERGGQTLPIALNIPANQ